MTIVASQGAHEYVTVAITETAGQPLDDIDVQLALGTKTAPGDWLPATTTPARRGVEARVLVGAGTAFATLGQWTVWARIEAGGEIAVRRLEGLVVLT